jgi:hypothetical protein
MTTQPTVDAAPTPPSPDSTLATVPVVPRRSARRATARRASSRRATARRHKDDVDGRIVEYVKDHPRSTVGDIAKGLNANRGRVAAGLSHLVRGQRHPVTFEAGASGQEGWATITAEPDDGPLRGTRIEVEVVGHRDKNHP